LSVIINNSSSGSGSLSSGSLDAVLPQYYDQVTGVVTGLSSAPVKVVGQVMFEEGVVVQSGMQYIFQPYQLNSNGFNWKLTVLGNEYWPGPGSIIIKVDYVWSNT
jgi:hypothetical protein